MRIDQLPGRLFLAGAALTLIGITALFGWPWAVLAAGVGLIILGWCACN